MFEKKYIITLKNFVGNVEIVAKPESIQVYDGVDIIYSLVSESDAYFIFISERGSVSEYCKILDQQLAQLYFALFFAIDSKEPQKINLDTTSNRLYYVDSNHREYDIPYLPNRINQFFYWAVVKLRNIRKWLSDLDDYSDTIQKYESTLLGFSSDGIIKNGLQQ